MHNDHIIVGGGMGHIYSFKSEGLLDQLAPKVSFGNDNLARIALAGEQETEYVNADNEEEMDF